jgi:hypothetical protein
MAFQKSLTHPATKASGEYVALVSYRWDRSTREASALFGLFKDAAHAAEPNAVPCAMVAKLRLDGDAFTRYFGAGVTDRERIASQLYAAAKVEPVISDFGDVDEASRGHRKPFAGARDV